MTTTTTTTHKTFTVGGTLFRFPVVPATAAPSVAAEHIERQAAILAAAEATVTDPDRKPATRKPADPFRAPRPGNGTFSPKPLEPGSRVRLSDGRDVEVWSAAPVADRFAVDTDGTLLRIYRPKSKSATRYGATATVVTREEQRAAVIEGVAKTGAMSRLIRPYLPAYPSAKWGTDDYDRQSRARNRAIGKLEDWAREFIAHELYPQYYPAPYQPTEHDGGQFALFDAA